MSELASLSIETNFVNAAHVGGIRWEGLLPMQGGGGDILLYNNTNYKGSPHN